MSSTYNFFSVIIITKHPDIFWSDLHSPPVHWEPSCGSLQSPSKPPLWRQQPQLLVFHWNLFFFYIYIRNWIKLKVNLYQRPWCLCWEISPKKTYWRKELWQPYNLQPNHTFYYTVWFKNRFNKAVNTSQLLSYYILPGHITVCYLPCHVYDVWF